ncbi:MAG: phospholipase D-like domain-containing protein [Bacteroidetes bacterium]|nr:phospholipase D-like domain-containing protein [Rhodothermia bacterium]MCX7907292.1 phospholipase D-like domain-containing protein [Bacteroidota bacterium]MDW8286166.1 phospholipase D-like domain-containing protein [Bacteroidota bacterium]
MLRRAAPLRWVNGLILLAALAYLAYRGGVGELLQRLLPSSEVPAPPLAPSEAVAVRQGKWFTAYFTRPRYPDRPETRRGGLDEVFAADLEAARRSVDIAVFDLDAPRIVEALVRAHRRGVRVRLVLDAENLSDPRMARAVRRLEAEGVPIAWDRRPAFMHHKFAILDGRVLWTGSWNMTENETYRNNNNMLRLSRPEIVANYAWRFEALFAGRFGSYDRREIPHPVVKLPEGARVETYFSPRGGAERAIERRLAAAQERILLMAFAFTANGQARWLIAKHRAGLQVRGIFETRNVEAAGADFERLRREGLDVLKDGNPYVMHHKVYVIDGRIVITGSYNFTANAERANEENLLIIEDPELARYYEEEFALLRAQAQQALAQAPFLRGP